jgi:hypothetical protein
LALEATRDIENLFRIISVSEVIFVLAGVNPEMAIAHMAHAINIPAECPVQFRSGTGTALTPGPIQLTIVTRLLLDLSRIPGGCKTSCASSYPIT